MWIFLSEAMLSIVAPKPGKGVNPARTVVVRARLAGDIERVFGKKVQVLVDQGTDYRYRALISRKKVAAVLAALAVDGIRYENFKDSVREKSRHDAYFRVWGAMADEQRRRYGAGPALRDGLFAAQRRRRLSQEPDGVLFDGDLDNNGE